MKIKKMTIKNIKGIEKMEWIPDDKIQYFIGKNGIGKSSFKEALQFALTGDISTKPFATIGAEECFVETELESGMVFSRNASSGSVTVNGRHSTAKSLSEALMEETGLGDEAMRVSTTGSIASMKPSELSEFLLSYIPERYNADTLLGLIPFLSKEEDALIRPILPPAPKTFDISEIDHVYSVLSDQLKAVKRELAQYKSKLGELTEYSEMSSARHVEDIDSDILKLYEAKGAEKLKSSREDKIKAQKDNIERLEKMLVGLPIKRPSPMLERELKRKINELEHQILENQQMIKAFETNAAFFSDALAVLSLPVCPLSENIVCTLDKTVAKEEIEECVNSNKKAKSIAENTIKNLLNEKSGVEKELFAFTEEVEKYRKYLFVSEELSEAKKLLEKSEDKITVFNFEKELEMLNEERIAAVNFYLYQDIQKKEKNAAERKKLLETTVGFFKPDGPLKSEIVGYYISVFESVCNKRAKEMNSKMSFVFSMLQGGIDISVKTNEDAHPLPISALSSGEKCMATFLLLDMLNQLNGFGILIIDDLDKLDIQNIRMLKKLLTKSSVQESYDHIVLCSVDHADIVKEFKKIS